MVDRPASRIVVNQPSAHDDVTEVETGGGPALMSYFVNRRLSGVRYDLFLVTRLIIWMLLVMHIFSVVVAVVCFAHGQLSDAVMALALTLAITGVLGFIVSTRIFQISSAKDISSEALARLTDHIYLIGNMVIGSIFIVDLAHEIATNGDGISTPVNALYPLLASLLTGSRRAAVFWTAAGWLDLNFLPASTLASNDFNARCSTTPDLAWRLAVSNVVYIIVCIVSYKVNKIIQSKRLFDDKKYDDVQNALDTSKAFIANATHELRTPLTQIIGLVQLCAETDLDENQRDLVETMHASAETLLALVNDVLDYQKITSGKCALEAIPFNIVTMVRSILKLVRGNAPGSSPIEIVGDITSRVPEIIIGDPMRLRQILQNVIGNAVKFTIDNTRNEIVVTIDVDTESARDDDGWLSLLITVADKGIGLTETAIDGLFKPFWQASPETTRMYGGTGLGLSICQSLVRLMGGRIYATSPGRNLGTTFHMSIPFRYDPSHMPPADTDITLTGPLAPFAVVYDNVPIALTKLSCVVSELGFRPVPFSDFSDLRQFMSQHADRVGVAVLDVVDDHDRTHHLPGVMEAWPTVPVVGLFALGTPHDASTDPNRLYVLHKPVVTTCVSKAVLEMTRRKSVARTPSISFKQSPRLFAAQSLHLLLVDDNAINLKVIGRIIETAGYTYETCTNGREAIDLVRARMFVDNPPTRLRPFDAVLTDLMMPVVDGLDFAKAVRDDERAAIAGAVAPPSSHLVIILITAAAISNSQADPRLIYVDDVLPKPFSRNQLIAKMAELMTRRRSAGTTPGAATPTNATDAGARLGDPAPLDKPK